MTLFCFHIYIMYGLDLEYEVLKNTYYKNSLKVIPNIDKSIFPE